MKTSIGLIVLLAGTAGVAQAEVRGAVTVERQASPRALLFDVDVPAPADKVWEALTTEAGMVTWITPQARVDLRPGGDWLALFPGAAPGGGSIVSFRPQQELVLRAMAPETFPDVRARRTRATFTLT